MTPGAEGFCGGGAGAAGLGAGVGYSPQTQALTGAIGGGIGGWASGKPVSVLSQYSYDPIYELTQAVVNGSAADSYSYDAVGNRLYRPGVPYTCNSSTEMLTREGMPYTYDNNFNRFSQYGLPEANWLRSGDPNEIADWIQNGGPQ